ncbi:MULTISPECIES: hypothetical protein [unclassified Ensifer]|uniref:hypothetical protein n=1 Tax=unclassified Ensifer TaxID=2633371 RepID=UPI0011126922|nr:MULTISPECIES: hypothetical protein [unclassified Ensifer]
MKDLVFEPHAIREFTRDITEKGEGFFQHPDFPYVVVLTDIRKQHPERFPARDQAAKEFEAFTADVMLKAKRSDAGLDTQKFDARDLAKGESPVDRALTMLRERIERDGKRRA